MGDFLKDPICWLSVSVNVYEYIIDEHCVRTEGETEKSIIIILEYISYLLAWSWNLGKWPNG